MNKILTGLAVVALAGSSVGANASVINCNMGSINNGDEDVCMNLDVDNNLLSFDLTSLNGTMPGNVFAYDLDKAKIFEDNSTINYALSSVEGPNSYLNVNDMFHKLSNDKFVGDIHHSNLTLNITDLLKDMIVVGEVINYYADFVNIASNYGTNFYKGEAFYAPSTSVPEPSTLGLFSLGLLGAGFVGSRRNKKTFESS